MSESQKRRFQRPEELKKLEKAGASQVVDFQQRAEVMQAAFLKKYGLLPRTCEDGDEGSKEEAEQV
jgi:hypothetical protein